MGIDQVGTVLMGTVLGWFLIFAVRRYKVQWGAFATFMAVVFGVSMLSFLYARDLLAYYGIGIFLGFVSNMVVRVAGTAATRSCSDCWKWASETQRSLTEAS